MTRSRAGAGIRGDRGATPHDDSRRAARDAQHHEDAEEVTWPAPSVYALGAVALLFVYLAVMSGHLMSMDGLYMERQAYSLMFERSFRFEAPLWTWRSEPTTNSLYGIGLSLLYLPGLLVAAPLAHRVPISLVPPPNRFGFYLSELYQDPLYMVGGSWLHPVLTAISAYLVARLVVRVGGSRRAALWAMALYGVGSPALAYSRGDFAQPLEGLCWLAALVLALTYRDGRRPVALAGCALATCFAILTRPVEGALLVPAAMMLAVPKDLVVERARALIAVGSIAGGALLGVAGTLFVNWQRWGSPFEFGYPEGNTWQVPDAMRWLAVLVSPGRGVVWEFPAIVFAPLGVWMLVRAGRARDGIVVAALGGALLVNVAAWAAWWGGWCWGLRLFLPAIPLAAVLAGIAIGGLGRRWNVAAAAALAAGFAWALPCTVTDILGGYGALTEDVPNGWHWQLSAYPPIGAWKFLTHVFARSATDAGAVDILWFRQAPVVGTWLLAVPAMLLTAAAVLVVVIRRRLTAEPEALSG